MLTRSSVVCRDAKSPCRAIRIILRCRQGQDILFAFSRGDPRTKSKGNLIELRTRSLPRIKADDVKGRRRKSSRVIRMKPSPLSFCKNFHLGSSRKYWSRSSSDKRTSRSYNHFCSRSGSMVFDCIAPEPGIFRALFISVTARMHFL